MRRLNAYQLHFEPDYNMHYVYKHISTTAGTSLLHSVSKKANGLPSINAYILGN